MSQQTQTNDTFPNLSVVIYLTDIITLDSFTWIAVGNKSSMLPMFPGDAL